MRIRLFYRKYFQMVKLIQEIALLALFGENIVAARSLRMT